MTITNRTIRTALPIIASTLCQKFGVQIALEGEEAYTNGKRIVLPALTKTDIDPTVVYGYLLHESGHVRHTTFNVKSKQGHNAVLHHALLNILEDGRIEKKMCDEYAGGYHWIQTLDAHILKKPEAMGSAEDMKAAKEPLALLMSFIYFFTRCNASGLTALYANQLRQTEADVKSRFGEAFTRDFTAVLNDSLTADSTRAQGKIADRLIALMKKTIPTINPISRMRPDRTKRAIQAVRVVRARLRTTLRTPKALKRVNLPSATLLKPALPPRRQTRGSRTSRRPKAARPRLSRRLTPPAKPRRKTFVRFSRC